jgi:hypothetical protein
MIRFTFRVSRPTFGRNRTLPPPDARESGRACRGAQQASIIRGRGNIPVSAGVRRPLRPGTGALRGQCPVAPSAFHALRFTLLPTG